MLIDELHLLDSDGLLRNQLIVCSSDDTDTL